MPEPVYRVPVTYVEDEVTDALLRAMLINAVDSARDALQEAGHPLSQPAQIVLVLHPFTRELCS